MVKKFDPAKLNLKDALDVAIFIEEDARSRYDDFVAQMDVHHTLDTAEFFRIMVVAETKHRDELTARRKTLFGDQPVTIDTSIVPEIEAPEYDKVRAFMTPRQALAIALQAEARAHDFYAAALKKAKDRDVKKLFTELREEEIEHQNIVKREIAKLTPEDPTRTEDYADEPNPQ